MIHLQHRVDGETVDIWVPETVRDLDGFEAFLRQGDKVLGLDTETSGLNPYLPDFFGRLIQFGNRVEAWVLRFDLFMEAIRRALRQDRFFVLHNAAFDLQVIEQVCGVKIEELGPRCFDTRILAHLLDPRLKSEGGSGLRLKELCEVYVDPDAADTQKGLHKHFNSLGFTKVTGWALIDIMDELYLRYAGLDPIYAARLFTELAHLVKNTGLNHLSKFEHHFMILGALMQRKGIRVDTPYVEGLIPKLGETADHFASVAARYGVANVNSTQQIATALQAMGEEWHETTDSGAPSVAKEVLLPMADLDRDWERIGAHDPNPLADAVLRSKRAHKWQTSYAQAFLDGRDLEGRLHATINALQARTARMSISDPALQQLPSSDWIIRRSLIADEGYWIVTVDYSQIEMRVLAGVADEPTMKAGIMNGRKLHEIVAVMMFGDEYTKGQYRLAKNTGFGEVFGGGAPTLARQAGVSLEVAKDAKRIFSEGFPGIKRYGRKLQTNAEFGKKEVVTPSGRHLPLDKNRLYAATNYVVQSTARDILAQAIVDLFDAGLGDYLLLPVHDEVVGQAPIEDAEDVAREIGRIMECEFMGVPITAEPEVYGMSWGHGYGAKE